jgi:hypothetical protein
MLKIRRIKMDSQVNQIDVLNTIAGRITNIVKGLGTEPCKLCECFLDYQGTCRGFSWDMTYHPPTDTDKVGEQGVWNLSVYHHTKEIWYITRRGTFVDIILAAYEKLASGEWRKTAKETWRSKEDKM